MRRGRTALLLIALCSLGNNTFAQTLGGEIDGLVVKVLDGDTLIIRMGDSLRKVRVAQVDAPELDQPSGVQAWQALDMLCRGRFATAYVSDFDRHGRFIGRVECAKVDAASSMVQRGLAWVYVRYTPRQSPLYELEQFARAQQAGLWREARPVPPWEWRRGKR